MSRVTHDFASAPRIHGLSEILLRLVSFGGVHRAFHESHAGIRLQADEHKAHVTARQTTTIRMMMLTISMGTAPKWLNGIQIGLQIALRVLPLDAVC
jgi:hypothetical protein